MAAKLIPELEAVVPPLCDYASSLARALETYALVKRTDPRASQFLTAVEKDFFQQETNIYLPAKNFEELLQCPLKWLVRFQALWTAIVSNEVTVNPKDQKMFASVLDLVESLLAAVSAADTRVSKLLQETKSWLQLAQSEVELHVSVPVPDVPPPVQTASVVTTSPHGSFFAPDPFPEPASPTAIDLAPQAQCEICFETRFICVSEPSSKTGDCTHCFRSICSHCYTKVKSARLGWHEPRIVCKECLESVKEVSHVFTCSK